MLSKPAEKIITRIQVLYYVFLLAHLLMAILCLFSGFFLLNAIHKKYLFYYPIPSFLFLSTMASFLLIRVVLQFRNFQLPLILRRLDEENRLLDRLSTYHQLRNSDHPFLPAFIAEINDKLHGVSPFRLLRRTSKLLIPAVCLIVLLSAIAFLPYLPEPESVTKIKQERKRVTAEAANLQKEILRMQKLSKRENLLKEFERTARELQKPDVTNEEALKKLNELQMKLEARAKELSAEEQKGLAEKINELAHSDDSPSEKNTLQNLADRMMNGHDSGEEQKEMQQVADEKLSAETRKKLRKAIQDATKEQKETAKQMAEMQNALENARKGIAPGTRKWTEDSRMSDRDVEKQKSGVSDGPGSTNQDVGPQHFDTRKKGSQQYMEDRTKMEYEQLFKGEREKAGSDPLFLKSQWDQNGEQKYVQIRNFGLQKQSNAQKNEVSITTQDNAESAIREEKVPASYQKIVKKYFDSIKQQ